jgi:hypothetical protein
LNVRTYIAEPKTRHPRRWSDKPEAYRRAIYNNRRRLKREKNKKLQRLRSERVERSFAHVCETGGARRTWLRGIEKVRKRYLMSAVARNLGLILRSLFGIGTPRSLRPSGDLVALVQFTRFYTHGLLRRLNGMSPRLAIDVARLAIDHCAFAAAA